jgi:hypothetical protein
MLERYLPNRICSVQVTKQELFQQGHGYFGSKKRETESYWIS